MRSGEIEAVIFDIGGVLEINKDVLKSSKTLHKNAGVHIDIAKKFKISLDQYFDLIDSIYVKSVEGRTSKKEVLEVLSKNFGQTKKKIEKTYYKLYKKYFKENKQLFKQAFRLKKRGYKIAILSDQWHLSKDALMPQKYMKKFDEVVISCDDKMRKPNIKIYKLILKRLGLKAKETVFIDNQKWNIKPAKKLGMNTILFKDDKQVFKQLEKIGVK